MDTLFALLAGVGTVSPRSQATASARREEGAARTQDSGALERLREADRRARTANSPAARAQQKLEEAERRLSQLRMAAHLAAASGDAEALERIAREAGTVAKLVGLAARGLTKSGAGAVTGVRPLPVGEAVGRVRLLLKQVKDILDDADRTFADGPQSADEYRRRRRILQEGRASIGEGRLAAAELEASRFHGEGGVGAAPVEESLDVMA